MIALRVARDEARRIARDASPLVRLAAFVLALVAALALFSPMMAAVPGLDVVPEQASSGPSFEHWLGTDHLGRDQVSRLLLATRSFVFPGALAAGVASILGVLLGATSGWFGGPTAVAIRWATGSLASLPRFVWVLLVCAAWGDSASQLGAAVGLAYAPALAEAVHARIESLRTTEYLDAARAHGVPSWRLLWVHAVLAGSSRLIARHAMLCFGYFLIVETTLAYIGGFGVKEPWPSLGNMLAFEWGWSGAAFAPAVAIWLGVACVIAVADALREDRHG